MLPSPSGVQQQFLAEQTLSAGNALREHTFQVRNHDRISCISEQLLASTPFVVTLFVCAQGLVVRTFTHGLTSVMTRAEQAPDIMALISAPDTYEDLANSLSDAYTPELFEAISGLARSQLACLKGRRPSSCPCSPACL